MAENITTNAGLLAPVVAVNLMNNLCLEELIALQKGEPFSRERAIIPIMETWIKLTDKIQR